MAKQGEAAYAYFLKGYNCSQSVVAAFAPQLGLSEEMALRMSAGFGAGIGRMREVCGAFCGVVTVLSLVYADPADPQDKSRMYALVQEAARLYRARNGGDSIICRELLAKAGANLTVDLPEAMLDRTADNEMRMLEQRLSRSNITLEKHCKNSHTTAAALRAGYRDAAERNLRSMLASRSIAEAENITVSTLEVNNEYRRLSQLQDTPEADIRRVLSPDTLAAALVAQKVQRFLLDNAQVTTVTDAPEKE